MKKLFVSALVGFAVFAIPFVAPNAAPMPKEVEVTVGINDAFIPSGFDAESEAYVVVNGLFPNGCYRWKRAEVKHDWATKIHEVRSVASVSQGMCIMVLVPFTQEVTLGKMGTGEHKVRFMNGDGTFMEKTLTIE
ncbi:MAG: hypothetical protein IT288_05095 [Bdellovibrionales bacterium]|nr:hypothetical protein [Bdellovibrionales bacterium]